MTRRTRITKNPRTRWRAVLDSSLGERGLPTRCALAQDLQDTYPELRFVRVTDRVISFTDSRTDERMSFTTPHVVRVWLDAFDDNKAPDTDHLILLKKDAKIKGSERRARYVPQPKGTNPGSTHKGSHYMPTERRVSRAHTAQ